MRVCSLAGCFYGGLLLKLALEESRPPMGCRLFVTKLGRFVATTVTLYEIIALIIREKMVMDFKLFRIQSHHSFIGIEPASFLLEPKPMLATRCMEIYVFYSGCTVHTHTDQDYRNMICAIEEARADGESENANTVRPG
jgi:hypothetical protein